MSGPRAREGPPPPKPARLRAPSGAYDGGNDWQCESVFPHAGHYQGARYCAGVIS